MCIGCRDANTAVQIRTYVDDDGYDYVATLQKVLMGVPYIVDWLSVSPLNNATPDMRLLRSLLHHFIEMMICLHAESEKTPPPRENKGVSEQKASQTTMLKKLQNYRLHKDERELVHISRPRWKTISGFFHEGGYFDRPIRHPRTICSSTLENIPKEHFIRCYCFYFTNNDSCLHWSGCSQIRPSAACVVMHSRLECHIIGAIGRLPKLVHRHEHY